MHKKKEHQEGIKERRTRKEQNEGMFRSKCVSCCSAFGSSRVLSLHAVHHVYILYIKYNYNVQHI
jgi:hypothetical protein